METREQWLKRTAFDSYRINAWLRSGELKQSPMGAWCLWSNYAELREATQGE